MIEGNSIIKASAGTGKTFALATRFIRLMMFDGARPEAIVALTFSRAAAQEIYEKILGRLSAAAGGEDAALREWGNLLDDFENDEVPDGAAKLRWILSRNVPHGAAAFRSLLRRLVDAQHLGTIATIDSFILRFIQNFPKEMGFQNTVEVLDPIDEDEAVDNALARILSGTGGSRSAAALAEAFAKTREGDFPRTCVGGIRNVLSGGWRDFALAHPECADWTVESMCAALGIAPDDAPPDLSGLPVNCAGKRKPPEAQFVEYVRNYDGSAAFPAKNKVAEMIEFFWKNPDAESWTYDFYRKQYVLDCGREGAAAIVGVIRHMAGLYLKRALGMVKARLDLVSIVEKEYSRTTRLAGKLTFNDFTSFTAENELSERGVAIKNIQFRFDSQFDHWALDEFQDTSELQWKCLRELVGEVAAAGHEGAGRSAMAVGDLKQSIYTWRGASALPFEDISGWRDFEGCARNLRKSYRYGPNIAEFINRVFGAENVRGGGIIPEECGPAADEWSAGWTVHVSDRPPDYVKVAGVAEDAGDEDGDAMLDALCEEVGRLWEAHENADSDETVGVLVRANTDGAKVAEYLRAKGLPAVWEGVNPVNDLPVTRAVLALLRLADHPGDTAAWKTAHVVYPVREKVFPGLEDAASVSAEMSRMLSRHGLARTLKEICERIGGGFDERSAAPERLRCLVEMAAAFDGRPGGGGVDAFDTFLAKAQKRELAVSPKVIRILSIHRSKGLGFDHVFVPLFETDRHRSSIDRPKATSPLFDETGRSCWVLPHLAKGMEKYNGQTRAAYGKMRCNALRDALRTYYVALTRAKKSMFVICPDDFDPRECENGLLMRDLVAQAVGVPYEKGEYPSFPVKRRRWEGRAPSRPWPTRRSALPDERMPPRTEASDAGHLHATADALFDAGYGTAAQKGEAAHLAYQAIEWADAETAAAMPTAFREAFVKPSPEATVWRERGYELFADGRWETGRFDRVVFTGTGESRRATVYDFKTNRKLSAETDEDFAKRMRVTYASQMARYRNAVAALTGIPLARVETKLLLCETGGFVL